MDEVRIRVAWLASPVSAIHTSRIIVPVFSHRCFVPTQALYLRDDLLRCLGSCRLSVNLVFTGHCG